MTREEASDVLDDYDVNFAGHTAEEVAEAFDVAFKALEQNIVLDKIRAEIAEFEEEVFHRTEDYSDYAAVRYCLEIIDKYMAGK